MNTNSRVNAQGQGDTADAAIIRVEVKNNQAVGLVVHAGRCLHRTTPYPDSHSAHATFDAQRWAERNGYSVIDNVGVRA